MPLRAMPKSRVVDNRNRPARPEPDEDPAVQMPPVREQAQRPQQKRSDTKK
jgi:hypothetical protein